MPQSVIKINTVIGSNGDLPINTLVQLDNAGIGGESTYLWTIMSQPEGTADSLSSTTIINPTFTPTKEGSYRIRLIVNQGEVTEDTDYAIVGILHITSGLRIPASGEETELDASSGWAISLNRIIEYFMDFMEDPGSLIGVAGASCDEGMIVCIVDSATIKSGLPGESVLPKFENFASVSSALERWEYANEPLYYVTGGIDGTTAEGDIIRVKKFGLIENVSGSGFTIGDDVIVGSDGYPTVDGEESVFYRKIGRVLSVSGSLSTIMFDGNIPIEHMYTNSRVLDVSASDTYVLKTDGLCYIDPNAAATRTYLPEIAEVRGRSFCLYLTDLGTMTVLPPSGTINGAAGFDMTVERECLVVRAPVSGTDWIIVSDYQP